MRQKVSDVYTDALELLKQLIAIPSFSKEEDRTCSAIERHMQEYGVSTNRYLNNVWALNRYFDSAKPTILLNSHHDTVRPNEGYTQDPFSAIERDGKLFGLGSNDAGGCLVSLLSVFLRFYEQEGLKYNLIFAASGEEEISGSNGIEALLPKLGKIDFAIVGEPTQMQMAVAEKGLMVLDCVALGKAGHAAREEGENAIYIAMKDIAWFSEYRFPKVSPLLGPVKTSVTVINAGTQHNIVPECCQFVADCRINELYTHEEVLAVIREHVVSEVKPRSLRIRSSSIAPDHPLVVAGMNAGCRCYGSPTTSDKALMPFPALKMGPGDSARSHMADEYIFVNEIKEGIDIYSKLLNELL